MDYRFTVTILFFGLLSSCGGGSSDTGETTGNSSSGGSSSVIGTDENSLENIDAPAQALTSNSKPGSSSVNVSNEQLTDEQLTDSALNCYIQGLVTEKQLYDPNTNIDEFLAEEPIIDFSSSMIDGSFDIGQNVFFSAHLSSVSCSYLTNYTWEQLSPKYPQIDLSATDQLQTDFLITESMNDVPFLFQLTVESSDGRTATKELAAQWQVNGARDNIQTGMYADESITAFHPTDLNNALIANAGENSIDQVNIKSKEILNSITLPGAPTIIEYISSENKLYVGLAGIGQIARIDVAAETVELIPTDGEAIDFAVRNEKLHFLIDSQTHDSDIFSLIDGVLPKRLGSVEGNSFQFSFGDELIVAGTGKISRYALKADGALFKIQQVETYNGTFGYSNASDTLFISHRNRTHTVLSFDLSTSLYFVDDGGEVDGFNFSKSEGHYIAFTKNNALVYDAVYSKIEESFKITSEQCDTEGITILDAQFGHDDKQILVLAECDDIPQSQFIYYSDSPLAVINSYY